MKKILAFLSVLLFFSAFSLDSASATWKNDSNTENKVTMSGMVLYSFKLTLRYDEEYTAGTTNNVTYRQSYINVDRSSPSVSSASSNTKVYDGSTFISQTSLFSRYYPDQVTPTGSQTFNYRNYESKSVKKNTGKSTNTSGVVISCSDYAPCTFPISVTLSY
ncbi:hypothetical protein [Lysinibacillus sp. RC79]|uniref:hypothetical protein n=1 Tax=Lysinibacillus sp. RC79 TaxID=3156296 RepID=UPI003511F26D